MEVVTGNLETRRDFTDVRDVVRAYWLLLEGAEPGAYNVCRGESVASADILARLRGWPESTSRQRTDPELRARRRGMEIRGSHDKLTAATGWKPEIPAGSRPCATPSTGWRERVAQDDAMSDEPAGR